MKFVDEKPTEKQVWAVNKIQSMHIYHTHKEYEMPNYTKVDYQKFISDHIDEYNEYKQWCINRRGLHYFDNPFAGPHGTDIVDCYDYGISPWGNS